jgi:hypothetical protein
MKEEKTDDGTGQSNQTGRIGGDGEDGRLFCVWKEKRKREEGKKAREEKEEQGQKAFGWE